MISSYYPSRRPLRHSPARKVYNPGLQFATAAVSLRVCWDFLLVEARMVVCPSGAAARRMGLLARKATREGMMGESDY